MCVGSQIAKLNTDSQGESMHIRCETFHTYLTSRHNSRSFAFASVDLLFTAELRFGSTTLLYCCTLHPIACFPFSALKLGGVAAIKLFNIPVRYMLEKTRNLVACRSAAFLLIFNFANSMPSVRPPVSVHYRARCQSARCESVGS